VNYLVKKTIVKDMGYKFLETNILLKSFKKDKPYNVDIHAWKKTLLGLSTKHLICFIRDVVFTKNLVALYRFRYQDLHLAYGARMIHWVPQKIMLVSSKGFESNAFPSSQKDIFLFYKINPIMVEIEKIFPKDKKKEIINLKML